MHNGLSCGKHLPFFILIHNSPIGIVKEAIGLTVSPLLQWMILKVFLLSSSGALITSIQFCVQSFICHSTVNRIVLYCLYAWPSIARQLSWLDHLTLQTTCDRLSLRDFLCLLQSAALPNFICCNSKFLKAQMASAVGFFDDAPSNKKKGSFLFGGASSTNEYFKEVCQKSLLCTGRSFSHEVLFLAEWPFLYLILVWKKRPR